MLQDHFRQAPFALSDLHMVCNACKGQTLLHVMGDQGLSGAGTQWVNGVGLTILFLECGDALFRYSCRVQHNATFSVCPL